MRMPGHAFHTGQGVTLLKEVARLLLHVSGRRYRYCNVCTSKGVCADSHIAL